MGGFRDDSGNGEVTGTQEGREVSEAGEASGVSRFNGGSGVSGIAAADRVTASAVRPGRVTASAMRRTLARARDGKPLDLYEATVLLHARGDDLHTLLGYASRTRDAGLEAAKRPGIITYSRKVFIPLTRLCRHRDGYCTFAT